MTMQEYDWYAHGFFIRSSKDHEGVRNVWALLHNVYSKNPIQNRKHLSEMWPLYIDKLGTEAIEDVDLKAKMFKLLMQKRELENAKSRLRSNDK
jgi:hypothetical protein